MGGTRTKNSVASLVCLAEDGFKRRLGERSNTIWIEEDECRNRGSTFHDLWKDFVEGLRKDICERRTLPHFRRQEFPQLRRRLFVVLAGVHDQSFAVTAKFLIHPSGDEG